MGMWGNQARRVRRGVVALAVLGLMAACGGSDDEGKPLDLTILHINDHHSTLDSKSKTLQLSTGGATPVAVAVDAGGFPRVTAAIEALRRWQRRGASPMATPDLRRAADVLRRTCEGVVAEVTALPRGPA